MNDGFVRPLMVEVLGRVAADQLSVALEPMWDDFREPSYTGAIQTLVAVRQQLQPATPLAESGLSKTEGEEAPGDPEELVIQDALTLVVDDALDVLLTAADSTSGG
jgi:hypothetical protein